MSTLPMKIIITIIKKHALSAASVCMLNTCVSAEIMLKLTKINFYWQLLGIVTSFSWHLKLIIQLYVGCTSPHDKNVG